MHIPDHVLDPSVAIATGFTSAAAVAYALHRVRSDMPERAKALIGMTAACVFAGQMVNFPIGDGTSGHLMGGVLAGILLGPWAGILAVTVVLLVQCVLFQDGGITALGANVLNMAVIGAGLGWAVYAQISRRLANQRGHLIAAAFASWVSVVLAAIVCSIELSAGAHYSLVPTLAAMLPGHSLIGVGEAVITGIALACLLRAKPALLRRIPGQLVAARKSPVTRGLAIAILVAGGLSPLATSQPDGLEASLQKLAPGSGIAVAKFWAPFADYTVTGLQAFTFAGSIAGLIGVLSVLILAHGLNLGTAALRLRREPRPK